MSDEQQFTRYRVIITVTSAVRTPAGSDPAPLKGARARPGGSDASPMLKAGPAGYSESPAFRRTKRDRVGPRGSRERARGVYQTHQATGGPSVLLLTRVKAENGRFGFLWFANLALAVLLSSD